MRLARREVEGLVPGFLPAALEAIAEPGEADAHQDEGEVAGYFRNAPPIGRAFHHRRAEEAERHGEKAGPETAPHRRRQQCRHEENEQRPPLQKRLQADANGECQGNGRHGHQIAVEPAGLEPGLAAGALQKANGGFGNHAHADFPAPRADRPPWHRPKGNPLGRLPEFRLVEASVTTTTAKWF